MSDVQYIDRDGDSWTLDLDTGEYYSRHFSNGYTLHDVRAAYGPLSVRDEDGDRVIPEEEYRAESVLRRIIREELDRRFGSVTP